MEHGIRKLRQCQPPGMAKLVVEQQDPIQHAGGNVRVCKVTALDDWIQDMDEYDLSSTTGRTRLS
jgi:hypothetical protein